MPKLRLLIDGGASSTRCRIVSSDGATVGEGAAGASSLTLGVTAAWRAVHAAREAALQAAGLPADADLEAHAAIAGSRNAAQLAAFRRADPMGRGLEIMTDGHAWLIGALAGRPGTVVAVGTGVAAHRLLPTGATEMSSGWGFPAGDEGGGAWIGLQAVQQLLRTLDGRVSRPGRVAKAVAPVVGHDVAPVQEWLRKATATEFAALAPLVTGLAGLGDRTAVAIVRAAGREIQQAVQALDRKAPSPQVCVVGGLADALTPFLADSIIERLAPIKGDALDGVRAVAEGRAPRDGF